MTESSFVMADEIDRLRGQHLAIALLVELRSTHYRDREGFTLRCRDLARLGLPRLSPKTLRKARDCLISAGLLVELHRGGTGRGDASRYVLAIPPAAPTPDDLVEDDPDDVFDDEDEAEDDADHDGPDDELPF